MMTPKRSCGLVVCISLLFCLVSPLAAAPQGKTQCIACHTNLKHLIRLCWEVEKIKPRSQGSAETSGEG